MKSAGPLTNTDDLAEGKGDPACIDEVEGDNHTQVEHIRAGHTHRHAHTHIHTHTYIHTVHTR